MSVLLQPGMTAPAAVTAHTPRPWEHNGSPGQPACAVWAGKQPIYVTTVAPVDVQDANARLIAAAPTMATYIAKRASEGDAEAISIMGAIRA